MNLGFCIFIYPFICMMCVCVCVCVCTCVRVHSHTHLYMKEIHLGTSLQRPEETSCVLLCHSFSYIFSPLWCDYFIYLHFKCCPPSGSTLC